jgi:4-hydroxybenzoate polyprenyltransferase
MKRIIKTIDPVFTCSLAGLLYLLVSQSVTFPIYLYKAIGMAVALLIACFHGALDMHNDRIKFINKTPGKDTISIYRNITKLKWITFFWAIATFILSFLGCWFSVTNWIFIYLYIICITAAGLMTFRYHYARKEAEENA